MQFSDVIGQRDVKQHLAEMISLNRLSHALLFAGREGSGALPLAIAFSQYIICESPDEVDSCDDFVKWIEERLTIILSLLRAYRRTGIALDDN